MNLSLNQHFKGKMEVAARWNFSLKRFFTEALEAQLLHCKGGSRGGHEEPPWMAGFGALSDLSDERRRVLGVIEEEFEKFAPEDCP